MRSLTCNFCWASEGAIGLKSCMQNLGNFPKGGGGYMHYAHNKQQILVIKYEISGIKYLVSLQYLTTSWR